MDINLMYSSSGGSTYLAEDAINKLGAGQFTCIMIATRRARELQRGAVPYVDDIEGHQFPVIALKEIAAGFIGLDYLNKPEETVPAPRQVSRHRRRQY